LFYFSPLTLELCTCVCWSVKMSFPTNQVSRFLCSFQDEDRAKLDINFVTGVHSVVSEQDTFKYQEQLPSLPVPALEDTIKRYIRSIKPIQTDPDAFARSEKAALDFLNSSCAEKLQRALEQRAEQCVAENRGFPHTHWLEEWWENLAYLSSRDPLAINLNCFGTLFSGISIDYGPQVDAEALALTRAAAVIYGTMQFRNALISNQLGPESLDRRGNIPLCMAQFNRVFSSVREPGVEMDKITQYDIDSDPAVPPHVAVWCQGRWYTMPLVRGDQRSAPQAGVGNDSALAVFKAYFQSLSAVRADANARHERDGDDLPVAVLTSAERTFWSKARTQLQNSNAVAAASLRAVESAAFHVIFSSARYVFYVLLSVVGTAMS